MATTAVVCVPSMLGSHTPHLLWRRSWARAALHAGHTTG